MDKKDHVIGADLTAEPHLLNCENDEQGHIGYIGFNFADVIQCLSWETYLGYESEWCRYMYHLPNCLSTDLNPTAPFLYCCFPLGDLFTPALALLYTMKNRMERGNQKSDF